MTPDLDCFASQDNAKCDLYYSKLPEANSFGINFFYQKLNSDHILYVCPPVSAIQRAWRKIVQTPNVVALLCVPYWRSHAYYADFLETDRFKPCVKDFFRFKSHFVSKSESCLFNGVTNFEMLALLIKT